ncbi:MAG: trigger factor [Lachnospiraceae bacterium]
MSNYAKRKQAEYEAKKKETKKAVLIIAAVVVVAAIIIGGAIFLKNRGDNAATASGDPNYDVFDYVTLGQYEGVEAYYVTPEVSDEDVQDKIDEYLEDGVEYDDISDRGVKKGDKVTIDFDGTIDGEEFEGGSATDYEYELGEGSMIDGFDEGLYGTKVGDSKTLNLTFPSDYDNAELAGKDVVFEVTVTKAQEISYQPKWNDEFVAKYTDGEYSTTEEYEEVIRAELLEDATTQSEEDLKADVWDTVYNNAKIDGYPEYAYNLVRNQLSSSIQSACSMYGISEDDYLNYFAGGLTMDEYILQNVNAKLVSEALVKEMGLEISDEEYQEYAKADLENYGVSSVEELEENYDKDTLMEHYTSQKLYDELVNKANVKEVSQEEYDELTSSDDEEE